jgi:lipoprotein LprG
MSRPRALVALFAVLVVGLAGCSKQSSTPGTTTGLPDGATLTTAAAAAMRDVTSAHITLLIDNGVSTMPLRRAEGDMTPASAKGSIQLEQTGTLIQYDFVLAGAFIYLKGVSGGWQKLPAAASAAIYDPSVVLNPDRGLARLLATAIARDTEGIENVNRASTYKVAVTFDANAVAALVPGVSTGATGYIWLDTTNNQLRRAVLTVAGSGGGKAGLVTMDLADIDRPVQISAPA